MRVRHVDTLTGVAATLVAVLVAHAARAQPSTAETGPPEAVLEIAFAESLIAPGSVDVAIADTSLAAGTASGAEVNVRLLAWPGWVIGTHIMAVQRASRDRELASSWLWQFGAELARRIALLERIELRVGLRGGYDLLKFADADTLTTGFGIAAMGSIHFRIEAGFWLELAAGVFAQPFAGNGLSDVTLPLTPAGSVGFGAQLPFM